jgi:hypothetical protein
MSLRPRRRLSDLRRWLDRDWMHHLALWFGVALLLLGVLLAILALWLVVTLGDPVSSPFQDTGYLEWTGIGLLGMGAIAILAAGWWLAGPRIRAALARRPSGAASEGGRAGGIAALVVLLAGAAWIGFQVFAD